MIMCTYICEHCEYEEELEVIVEPDTGAKYLRCEDATCPHCGRVMEEEV